MKYRDHRFLGMTQSLCPECLELIPAKIICRDEMVYFRKNCPVHGNREDFVCSDVNWFDRLEFSLPGKVPARFGIQAKHGCPFDCGLCTEHEQHTCIGLLEITSHCNLECPICFAGSGPGGEHLSLEQCQSAVDALVEAEGRPEVLQLSGGEPTIHPQFLQILDYCLDQPIDVVMINTNGIRIARDPEFVSALADRQERLEVYFQFDSFQDDQIEDLRGLSLVETKMKALEILGAAGIRTTLVCTLQRGVNENQIGPLVEYAIPRNWITGVSFQPTTYTGRYYLPNDMKRITFPEVLMQIQQQTNGQLKQVDFTPLPCAHPNAHTICYVFRDLDSEPTRSIPLARFVDLENHLELLAGRITFDRGRTRELVQSYLASIGCGTSSICGANTFELAQLVNLQVNSADTDKQRWDLIGKFVQMALAQKLAPENMLRITTTTFMDAYNFDVRQLMKSCVHHILPSGHIIPFSAYNIFYRYGKLPLTKLEQRRPQPA